MVARSTKLETVVKHPLDWVLQEGEIWGYMKKHQPNHAPNPVIQRSSPNIVCLNLQYVFMYLVLQFTVGSMSSSFHYFFIIFRPYLHDIKCIQNQNMMIVLS